MSKGKGCNSPGYCDAEWLDYNTGQWHRCAIVTAYRMMRPIEDWKQADSFIIKDELGQLLKIEASELRLLDAPA